MFHTRQWSATEIFKDVSRAAFRCADKEKLEERYANLWQGLCSESDASALKAEIYRLGLLVTPDARQYIELWSRDESRHAEGFTLLLEILCGLDRETINSRLMQRSHDFSTIRQHVVDEFSLLTIIAFDEIATCRGYSRDREFYAELGHPAFLSWIKATIADEVTHATNAVRVIHKHHAHRLDELDSILSGWIGSATSHESYRGTFLMDSLDLGYFQSDFPDFAKSLKQLFAAPDVLQRAAGKSVFLDA